MQRDFQETAEKGVEKQLDECWQQKKGFFNIFQCLCYHSYSNKMNFKQERFCKFSKAIFSDSILKQFKVTACLLLKICIIQQKIQNTI